MIVLPFLQKQDKIGLDHRPFQNLQLYTELNYEMKSANILKTYKSFFRGFDKHLALTVAYFRSSYIAHCLQQHGNRCNDPNHRIFYNRDTYVRIVANFVKSIVSMINNRYAAMDITRIIADKFDDID